MASGTNNRTITELRAFTALEVSHNTIVRLTDAGKQGAFQYDSTDTTTADNTGTVVVTASGARYKRIDLELILSSWFDVTNTGFQNFITACAGRIGQINNSFTLTTNITMDSGEISMRNGLTVSTNAAVGFTWTRKKGFIARGWNFTTTNVTTGSTLLKIDGLWNATFDNCTFNSIPSNVDVMQLLPGDNGSDKWGTYFCNFNNMKTGGGRYICNGTGATGGVSYLTHILFNDCWATEGVSYIKGLRCTAFGTFNLCADSLSSHAFDLDACSDFTLHTKEVTPGGGGYTLNETSTCNKNFVTFGSRITDFTSNLDTLGITPDSITLQGGNVNADNFKTRLKNVFSYVGTLLLQAKGGTNTWTDILKWSETIGLEIQSGWSNYIRLKEQRISLGQSNQINYFVKTMTATSSQFQDLIYFSLNAVSQSVAATVTIHYFANDNSVSCIQKILVAANNTSEGTVSVNTQVEEQLSSVGGNLPLVGYYYAGFSNTFSLTHTNLALAATMYIKIEWSATSSVTVS